MKLFLLNNFHFIKNFTILHDFCLFPIFCRDRSRPVLLRKWTIRKLSLQDNFCTIFRIFHQKLHDISRFLPVFFILGRLGGSPNIQKCFKELKNFNTKYTKLEDTKGTIKEKFARFALISPFLTKNFTIFHDFCLFLFL